MGEEKKLDELFELVKEMNHRVLDMDGKIQSMDSKIQSMDREIRNINGNIKNIYGILEHHDNDIRDLQLTLENVTNRNISIIAENHIELNRKLNEALKRKEEDERLYMRMNIAENDIRRLKEKAGIA